MKVSSAKIPWFGVALIIFGALLLIDKLDLVDLSFHEIFWPVIMLLGLAGVGRGFTQNKKAKIFFGTVVFLYALFFFLHSMESVDLNSYLAIPSTFLILGIAFLMVFCNNFQEWIFLIPSLLLGGIGVALILGEMGVLYYWEVWDAVAMYWPVALVLFGLGMVLRRKVQQPDNHATT
jgi:hypothetical protein